MGDISRVMGKDEVRCARGPQHHPHALPEVRCARGPQHHLHALPESL